MADSFYLESCHFLQMRLSFYGSLINLFIWEISNLNYKGVIISLTPEKVIDLLHNLEKKRKEKRI